MKLSRQILSPEILTDDNFLTLPAVEKLFWLSIYFAAENSGCFKAAPYDLKASLLPLEDELTVDRIKKALAKFESWFWLIPYTAGGEKYYFINKLFTFGQYAPKCMLPPWLSHIPSAANVYMGKYELNPTALSEVFFHDKQIEEKFNAPAPSKGEAYESYMEEQLRRDPTLRDRSKFFRSNPHLTEYTFIVHTPEDVEELINALGLSEKTKQSFYKVYSFEQIARQLEYLPFRQGVGTPAGIFKTCLEQDIEPPQPRRIKATKAMMKAMEQYTDESKR